MGEPLMELGDQELEKIGRYVQTHLEEWNRTSFLRYQNNREIELVERIVRVEESLNSQLKLMQQGFDQIDKRFEQVDKRFEQVDKRFEQVDKRFEDMQHYMDKRFNTLQWSMGIGVTLIVAVMSLFNYL